MSVAELQELEEVRGLITRGRRVGVLTYAEIATATAEFDLDETDLEELHGLLERCEIELVEEIDPATQGCPGSQAGGDYRRSAAVPQEHRQGAAADRPAGGWSREADRARGPGREAEDGRVQPPAGRLDREELPQSGAAVPRPDPGRDTRSRARGGEVRLPQGL